MSNPGFKAGLIGAAVAVVLSLLSLVPCLGCLTPILGLLLYVAVGVLAAYWLPPPRTAGSGAKVGAIAGVITALVGGIVGMIVSAIQFAVSGGTAAVLSQLPPETLSQLQQAGLDPGMFASVGGVLGVSAVCCVFGLVLAAVLGAIGGAILAAAKSE